MPRYISPARLKYNAALAVLKRERVVDFGRKQIFLPTFTIALLPTPELSPYHAKFRVPLQFAKPDLRDYLFHLYNIRAFNMRSYIKQAPVRDTQAGPRQWFRDESTKYMTIEMEEPFVWPEKPTRDELDDEWGLSEQIRQEKELNKSVNAGAAKQDKQRQAKALRQQAADALSERRKNVGDQQEQLATPKREVKKERENFYHFPSIDDKRYKIKL